MNDAIKKILEEQFKALPKSVQNAIASGKIDEQFKVLAEKHKLHLDQWQALENQIMLTVLGLSEPDALVENITKEVVIARERAQEIVDDIATTVFKPIREELERQLEHPDAQAKEVSEVEAARAQALEGSMGQGLGVREESANTQPPTSVVQPATPPPSAPEIKVTRPTDSSTYKPGIPSDKRDTVHDDPYREPPL